MAASHEETVTNKAYEYIMLRNKFPSSYVENVKPPMSGSTTTISAQTSTTTYQFIQDRDVINSYLSTLSGSYSLTAPNAGLAGFIANRPWISSMKLSNSSLIYLVNITYAQEYLQICRLRQMSWDKWLTKQLSDHACPTHLAKTSTQALLAVPTAIGTTYSSANPSGGPVPASSLDIDQTAPLLIRSVAPGTLITSTFTWQLGDLFGGDSFFGLNLDLYFPEQLTLSVEFAAEQSFFWSAFTQSDATLGAANPNNGVGTLTNLRMRWAVQSNSDLRAECMKICKSGFALPIPYTQSVQMAQPANVGTISQDIPLSSGFGSELRYIVVSFWDQSRTLAGCSNCSNIDGGINAVTGLPHPYAKIASYQTKVGSRFLQAAPLNCTPVIAGFTGVYQDYEYNRKLGGTSPLYQSRLVYQAYWHHVDDFKGSKAIGEPSEFEIGRYYGGIPLAGRSGSDQIIYNFTATCPATTSAMSLIAFITTTKTLIWGDNLVSVV